MTTRTEKLKVARIAPAATGVLLVRLVAEGGTPLPGFQPGAHIEISFDRFRRRYSLTSSPKETSAYEICVLRTPNSRGGSHYIHDELRVGETVVLEGGGPNNAFPLAAEAEHSVFIAGGIGVTPFLSMIEALEDLGRSYELHYVARTKDRFIGVGGDPARIFRLADQDANRQFDVDRLLDALSPKSDLYICGPRPMIEAVRTKARARGWPPARIHYESFGASRAAEDAPVEVTLALSGETLRVDTDMTILDALIENGVWAPYECRRGECAYCMTEVLSGDIDHRDHCLNEVQRKGHMCTCVSWARGGITLNI